MCVWGGGGVGEESVKMLSRYGYDGVHHNEQEHLAGVHFPSSIYFNQRLHTHTHSLQRFS